MGDLIDTLVDAALADVTCLRHHLHQHPELSDHEAATAALLASRLRNLGLRPRTGVGGHGLQVDIAGQARGPLVALRADIDALPIQEEGDLPYRSVNPGVMHACGHDGHAAMLVGIARILDSLRPTMAGTVRLIFQPAEETVGGARRMISDGVMDGVEAIAALHGWLDLDVGQIGVRTGPMMASADTFDIVVNGQGAHAAYPHLSIDPIVVGARLVEALQTVVSREVHPSQPVVVTVSRFNAGSAYNIIPAKAALAGTFRTLDPGVRHTVGERIARIASGVCTAAGCTCDVKVNSGTPPVVNDALLTDLVSEVAASTLGPESVVMVPHASMGAEDFAFYLEHAPGVMFRLGLGSGAPGHTSEYDFADAALPIGMSMLTRVALSMLERRPT